MMKRLMVAAAVAILLNGISANGAVAKNSVSDVKSWLNDLGFYVGPPNEDLDDTTIKAIAKLQADESLTDVGQLTPAHVKKLERMHKDAERKLRIAQQFSWNGAKLTVNDYNNKRPPRLIGGELVSQIFDRECVGVDYGDGRGESDCSNGNVGSAVETTRLFKLNSNVRIEFDFWIQPNLDAQPQRMYSERGSFTSDPFHSTLIMFELERTRSIKNHVYDLDVDSVRGVTFLDKNCITPKEFGIWHRFEFDLFYSSKQDGTLTVKCDGRTIYQRASFNSALNPFCYEANGCAPQFEQLYSEPMRLELGAQMRGNGWSAEQSGQPTFNKIQPDGIMIRYRDLVIKYK
jgi:hypothetical protein